MKTRSSFFLFTGSILSTVPCDIGAIWYRRRWEFTGLPSLSQWNDGGGCPDALQKKLTIDASVTRMFFGAYVIFGAAEKRRKSESGYVLLRL